MSKILEPPSFISETKSYETYEKDLKRWALLTSVDEKKQALMVVHYLDGDPSGIKDKIDAELEDAKLQCTEGINYCRSPAQSNLAWARQGNRSGPPHPPHHKL